MARLGVFSARPAPVQVTWLGYLNTSGLTRMDFRLSDARCDPLDVSQPCHAERLVHLPASQWCYRPVARASDAQALRALRPVLRERLRASPLTDLPRFARDLESAYRAMWLEKVPG